jgi:biotin operon repressor
MVATSKRITAPAPFVRLPKSMWEHRLPVNLVAVWLALYSFDGMTDGSRPGLAKVMAMTRLKRSAVKNAITDLRKTGLLEVEARGNGSLPNRYRFPNAGGHYVAFEDWWWEVGLTAPQIAVLLALRHFEGLHRGAVPSSRDIATMLKMSKDTVLAVIEELQQTGLVVVERRCLGDKALSHRFSFVTDETALPAETKNSDVSTCDVPEDDPLVPVADLLVPEDDPLVPETGHESPLGNHPEGNHPERITLTKAPPGGGVGQVAGPGRWPGQNAGNQFDGRGWSEYSATDFPSLRARLAPSRNGHAVMA